MRLPHAILALAVFAAGITTAQEKPAAIADWTSGRAPAAILRTMPSATPPNQRLAGLTFIAGYEIIGQPIPLPTPEAARLAAITDTPSAFGPTQNEEEMRPGVAYRFGSGEDAVDLLVCFSCDKAAIVPVGAETLAATRHITQAARDVLLEIAKQLLPDDEAIQALPRVRSEKPVPPPPIPLPANLPPSTKVRPPQHPTRTGGSPEISRWRQPPDPRPKTKSAPAGAADSRSPPSTACSRGIMASH